MRSLPLAVVVVALTVVACKKGGDDKPRKLKKVDYKVFVDERGRMLPQLELFDDKHSPIVVLGTYTMTLSRPDGTVLCSVTRTVAKEDYTDKKLLKTDWQDASCPPDPAAEELRVTLEVTTGDKPDDPKLARDKTTPTKFIYRHLAKPAAPAGSASGSAAPAVDPTKLPAEAPLPEPPPGPTPPADGSGSTAEPAGSAK